MLGVFTERHESQIDAFRCADAKIGTRRASRLLSRRTPELTLCFDPPTAKGERVGFAILAVGHKDPVSDHNVLERTNRRQLAIERLALGKERHVEARFHREESRATRSI